MKGKGKGKKEGGQLMPPEIVEQSDPDGVFRKEVSQLLQTHWNISEPLRVQNISFDGPSTFYVKAPEGAETADGEYVV